MLRSVTARAAHADAWATTAKGQAAIYRMREGVANYVISTAVVGLVCGFAEGVVRGAHAAEQCDEMFKNASLRAATNTFVFLGVFGSCVVAGGVTGPALFPLHAWRAISLAKKEVWADKAVDLEAQAHPLLK